MTATAQAEAREAYATTGRVPGKAAAGISTVPETAVRAPETVVDR